MSDLKKKKTKYLGTIIIMSVYIVILILASLTPTSDPIIITGHVLMWFTTFPILSFVMGIYTCIKIKDLLLPPLIWTFYTIIIFLFVTSESGGSPLLAAIDLILFILPFYVTALICKINNSANKTKSEKKTE